MQYLISHYLQGFRRIEVYKSSTDFDELTIFSVSKNNLYLLFIQKLLASNLYFYDKKRSFCDGKNIKINRLALNNFSSILLFTMLSCFSFKFNTDTNLSFIF